MNQTDRAVPVAVFSGYGINAERELADAFREVGARVDIRHVGDLAAQPRLLDGYRIVGIAGGFSFGDHLGSGKVLASIVRAHLRPALERLVERGGLVIGICNGFQILVKSGMLPNLQGNWEPEVSLIHNDSGRFEDSWVRCSVNAAASTPWLRGLRQLDLPIRHGEGRFVYRDEETRRRIREAGIIAFRYLDRNPNGSADDVAGISDAAGHVLGLMPHPEAFRTPLHHPRWSRGEATEPNGLAIFRNGVQFAADF